MYHKSLSDFLSYVKKSERVNVEPGKEINTVTNMELRIMKALLRNKKKKH